MSKMLVLAEKPSVGRDIGKVLGCVAKGQSYMEGEGYVVTWALGHLVTLAAPEKYNKSYSEWSLNALPMVPDPFKLEVIKNTSGQYFQVRKLMERKDISEIIIATDAGREGELVARWIIDYAHCKKPIKRLWISSVTDKAIKEGFGRLVNGHQYDHLYMAAKSRAEADWILGLNGTRALTMKHNASLSLGRVQTPTLGLIQSRETAIRQFVSKPYYELVGDLSGIRLKACKKGGEGSRYNQKAQAEQALQACNKQPFIVTKVVTKAKEKRSLGFYDLTTLQRDANRKYGYSAKETLTAMQGLYERHKVLSYPRTDSQYITEDIVATLIDRLRACRNGQNKVWVGQIIKSGIQASSSFVNAKKVGDHHGIIPTEVSPDYHSFSPKEQKIYNMVIEKFIATLMPPYRYEEVDIEGQCGEVIFRGKRQRTIDLGYKEVYGDVVNIGSDKALPIKGQKVALENLTMTSGETKPPSHLTEGDLLEQMEKLGLGTVATRADIIEKLLYHNYMDKQKQMLRISKTGRQLLTLVPEPIRSSDLTAKWEKDLALISEGKKKSDVFMNEIIEFTKVVVKEIRGDQTTFHHDNVSSENCPDCGKKLLSVENKFGKKLVCPDRACGYKKNIAKTTNARCPNCHKKLALVGEGDQQTFVCKCGHKEKLSAFNKRKAGNKSVARKSEVQKYLNKASKEKEVFNNPFAALLGDIKED